MNPILNALNLLLTLYGLVMLLRVLISWFPIDRDSSLVRVLVTLTEPVLEPIRSILPSTGPMDFSPMVAMLIIFALQRMLTILAR